MNKTDVQTILTVLNSSNDLGFKYPIGNKELTIKVRQLESEGTIRYQAHLGKWTDKKISYSNKGK